MSNLVLIGMPGSGKSSVGAALARSLGRALLDTDALVEADEGMSIPEIFSRHGEVRFRDAETRAARRAAQAENAVVATGGGVVLRPENMAALGETGLICFLDRPPEEIVREDHSGRPLIGAGRDKVFSLYDQRIGLYRKYARYTVASRPTPEETARALLTLLEGAL